jgi:hypothetical protein
MHTSQRTAADYDFFWKIYLFLEGGDTMRDPKEIMISCKPLDLMLAKRAGCIEQPGNCSAGGPAFLMKVISAWLTSRGPIFVELISPKQKYSGSKRIIFR